MIDKSIPEGMMFWPCSSCGRNMLVPRLKTKNAPPKGVLSKPFCKRPDAEFASRFDLLRDAGRTDTEISSTCQDVVSLDQFGRWLCNKNRAARIEMALADFDNNHKDDFRRPINEDAQRYGTIVEVETAEGIQQVDLEAVESEVDTPEPRSDAEPEPNGEDDNEDEDESEDDGDEEGDETDVADDQEPPEIDVEKVAERLQAEQQDEDEHKKVPNPQQQPVNAPRKGLGQPGRRAQSFPAIPSSDPKAPYGFIRGTDTPVRPLSNTGLPTPKRPVTPKTQPRIHERVVRPVAERAALLLTAKWKHGEHGQKIRVKETGKPLVEPRSDRFLPLAELLGADDRVSTENIMMWFDWHNPDYDTIETHHPKPIRTGNRVLDDVRLKQSREELKSVRDSIKELEQRQHELEKDCKNLSAKVRPDLNRTDRKRFYDEVRNQLKKTKKLITGHKTSCGRLLVQIKHLQQPENWIDEIIYPKPAQVRIPGDSFLEKVRPTRETDDEYKGRYLELSDRKPKGFGGLENRIIRAAIRYGVFCLLPEVWTENKNERLPFGHIDPDKYLKAAKRVLEHPHNVVAVVRGSNLNLSCGACKRIQTFDGSPLKCCVCGWVLTPLLPTMNKQSEPEPFSVSNDRYISSDDFPSLRLTLNNVRRGEADLEDAENALTLKTGASNIGGTVLAGRYVRRSEKARGNELESFDTERNRGGGSASGGTGDDDRFTGDFADEDAAE